MQLRAPQLQPRPPATALSLASSSSSCSSRRPRAAAAARASSSTPAPSTPVALFELGACVHGLEPLTAAWAQHAARAVFGNSCCPGSWSLYAPQLRTLLPALAEPWEAALLLRLLADEGCIGGRSTAGREGPVVGRALRHSGSRPLLANEVLEFWVDEVLPTCLLRWSRELQGPSDCCPTELQARLAAAYEQAQASVPWRIVDVQQHCHGSSSSSSSSAGAADRRRPAASSSSSSSRGGGGGGAAPAVMAAAAGGAAAALAEPPPTAVVQPHLAAVQAIVSSQQVACCIASTLPLRVTRTALAAVGLGSVAVVHGQSLLECVQQQQQQQQQAHASIDVVLSAPSRATLLLQQDSAAQKQQQQQRDSAVWQRQQQHVRLHVGEWACPSAPLRAKALASPGVGLLSEFGLAELLGVTECDAVLDGVAWR